MKIEHKEQIDLNRDRDPKVWGEPFGSLSVAAMVCRVNRV